MCTTDRDVEERIERHLMRQRGAGIRTVSTNFGFAFGSQSEETSSNATPTREVDEPPAKRRKTVLSNECVISEVVPSKSVKVASVKRVNKARRRFPLEDDDVRPPSEPVAEDDSFVAVLGSKRAVNKSAQTQSKSDKKAQVVEKQKKTAETMEDPATTVTRPRRRAAAAAAASKVAEGFEEEQTSVDKKRQDPEPTKRASESRKKNTGARSPPASKATSDKQLGDVATATAKAPPRKRAAAKKRKATAESSVVESEVVQAVNVEMDELATDIAISMQADTANPRDHLELTKAATKAVCKSKARKPPAKKRKRQSSMDLAEPTQAFTERLFDPPLNHYVERTATLEPDRTERGTRQKRQPLAEADMNTTVRSSSPEKATLASSKELNPLPKKSSTRPAKTSEHLLSTRPRTAANKKRRLDIKLNAIGDENQNVGAEPTSEHLRDKSSSKAQLVESKDAEQSSLDRAAAHGPKSADQQRAISTFAQSREKLIQDQADVKASPPAPTLPRMTAKATKAPGGRSKARPITCQTATSTLAQTVGTSADRSAAKCTDKVADMLAKEAREEDVDWLFAPQSQTTAPKTSGLQSKSGNARPKSSKFKMADMDLDDLLSNIASFAQDKAMPGGENVTLFAGGQQKSRSGSKKTKS